ncbi:S10 family peptidase [Sphingomonas sp.]|uniref:S10 family peptidase n=1 Tax=Sphingomonas sp. TaxID=28214 RepID=UPI002DB6C54C|nr:peptidase S10 [Sphingomonas sp.]HEU4968610.1 peptidase S10 [Sphingomonas sp.]
MRSTIALMMLMTAVAAPAQETAPDKTPAATKLAKSHQQEMIAEAEDAWVKPPVDEPASVSHGAVTVEGQRIAYTATAGTLTIRDNDGKPTGSMFYTAYTKDGAAPSSRPVTFFYNGGPGSATVWLHMGSFAPVRVTTANPEYIRPAPYGFGPNPHSLIDKTDLVFIDMMGAGWSRPLGAKTGKDFWGVDQDADAFARTIERYVTKNGRWTSPKFLFGESYGTLRNGAVAALLEERGLSLNGIVYLSSIMNYGVRQPGYDANYLTLFPGYAATAWYHNHLQNRPPNLEAFLQEVRAFTSGPYAAALAKGSTISPEEKRQIAEQMSKYIGISPDFIMRADLRVDLNHFRTELLRDRRLAIGRLDSRYTLIPSDANAERPDDDPSSTAISGAFISSFMDYAKKTLGYHPTMPYRISARQPGFNWDWKHEAPGSNFSQNTPNTAIDLAYTMRTNPYLKVLFLNGYYDMATPFYGTEFDVSHMLLEPSLQRNVEFKYYESGHMVYLNPAELAKMHDDLAVWYDQTLSDARSSQPPAKPVATSTGAN